MLSGVDCNSCLCRRFEKTVFVEKERESIIYTSSVELPSHEQKTFIRQLISLCMTDTINSDCNHKQFTQRSHLHVLIPVLFFQLYLGHNILDSDNALVEFSLFCSTLTLPRLIFVSIKPPLL